MRASLVLFLYFTYITTTMAASVEKPDFSVFKGTWIRTDGGYVIHVNDIGLEGQVDVIHMDDITSIRSNPMSSM